MKSKKQLIWIVIALLLVVDVLTFHDVTETHTLRDWLTLAASILLIINFFKEYKNK